MLTPARYRPMPDASTRLSLFATTGKEPRLVSSVLSLGSSGTTGRQQSVHEHALDPSLAKASSEYRASLVRARQTDCPRDCRAESTATIDTHTGCSISNSMTTTTLCGRPRARERPSQFTVAPCKLWVVRRQCVHQIAQEAILRL